MTFKDGDFVLINYVISVKDGDREIVEDTNKEDVAKSAGIYDSNRRYEPYLVVIGRSQVIKAIDEQLRDMDVGQRKEFTATPDKAYGPYRSDLIIRLPIKQLNRYGIPPVVGRRVEVGGRIGVIRSVTERFAYIDFNHPLAGRDLKVELEVVGKLETLDDKVKYLVTRYMPLDRNSIGVSQQGEGSIELQLPQEVLGLSDLESRLQLLLGDLSSLLGIKGVKLVVNVALSQQGAQASGQQASQQQQEAQATPQS
ncbi:FKBP-type peptidyl-prolyl cis-trans isomerase [Acidilobus sp.]|uniref:FKBP-type peptidyl-prolyl cis-trans isomerase n=1 Tax=Acidilobus sp. TaxID=1872109 RepID=UPI003D086DD0